MKPQTNNSHRMKATNLATVLEAIIQGKAQTRTDLTRVTNLSKMAITNLTNELFAKDILCEAAPIANLSAGKRPLRLDISPKAPLIIGVAIDRSTLCMSIANLKLEPVEETFYELHGENLSSILEKIDGVLDGYVGKYPNILGIGIVTPGPIDGEKRMILNPPNFFGISNFDIGGYYGKRYRLPTFLVKDGNACAIAEKLVGVGKNIDNFIFILVTLGVGGGIIANNTLLFGKNSNSGEIGHTTINYKGERCYCGNRGCLELYTNIQTIINKFNKAADTHCASFREVIELCRDNKAYDNLLYPFFDYLILGITNAINTLDTQAVILGGEFTNLLPVHIAYFQEKTNRMKLWSDHGFVNVYKSQFETHAKYLSIGATSVVLWDYLGKT